MTIGDAIKKARAHRRLSQGQLANLAGITQSTLSAIEKGHHPPSKRTKEAIMAALAFSETQFNLFFIDLDGDTETVAIFINMLVDQIYSYNVSAGWHDKPREFGTMISLAHSELSEALEGDRKGLMDDHLPHRKMAEVELADAVIRICDLAGKERFDLGGALVEKRAYNSRRVDHKKETREKQNGKKY